MVTRLLIFILCAASAWSQQGQFVYGSQLLLGASVSLNTCPTPNYKFGPSNIVWVEASTVTPATEGAVVTSIPNLVCTPNIVIVNGALHYSATGGGSSNTLPQVIMTNMTAATFIGQTNAVLFANSNYTVMIVEKMLASDANKSLPIYWGDGTISQAPSIEDSTDGAGNPTQLVMQGSQAGQFISANTSDLNWHVWTFIQSNNVGFIRKDMVLKATGTVGNANGFGKNNSKWSIFGSDLAASHINSQWTRALIWTNWLNFTDTTNYESICTNDFFSH